MEIVLMLLCIAGLSFAIRQLEGPFDVFSIARNLIAKVPVLGPMFHKVLTCNFCLGLWASAGLYLFTNPLSSFSVGELIVWSFGGAMFNSLFVKLMDKLDLDNA